MTGALIGVLLDVFHAIVYTAVVVMLAAVGVSVLCVTGWAVGVAVHTLRGIRQDKARMAREGISTGDSDGLTRDWGWRS